MESLERRLPVYFLLDCSESMVGDGIDAVQKGVRQLLLDLHSDPHALETVWVSIITFADTATQVVPLTELTQIRAPKLKVRPGTSMGAALDLLRDCIRREVRTHSAQAKGDWKPLVFLLTDGVPTDDWEEAARAIHQSTAGGSKTMNLIAIGCGEDVDPLALQELTDTVLLMKSDQANDFRSLFQWISSSLSVTSQQIATPGKETVSLAKVPPGLLESAGTGPLKKASALPSQLFISLRCSTKKKPYLMRYHLSLSGDYYEAVRSHVVDEDYFAGQGEGTAALNMSSNRVIGVLPCPHCGNPAAGQCPCGQIFCAPAGDEPIECPGCLRVLGFGGEGEFSLSGRMG